MRKTLCAFTFIFAGLMVLGSSDASATKSWRQLMSKNRVAVRAKLSKFMRVHLDMVSVDGGYAHAEVLDTRALKVRSVKPARQWPVKSDRHYLVRDMRVEGIVPARVGAEQRPVKLRVVATGQIGLSPSETQAPIMRLWGQTVMPASSPKK